MPSSWRPCLRGLRWSVGFGHGRGRWIGLLGGGYVDRVWFEAETAKVTRPDVGAGVLTAMSFWVANTSLLWSGGISLGLTVLAIAQMVVHLVFFLHVPTGRDNTNNVMALAFGVLIVALVVVGSLLILADLNDSMMPAPELMNLQMQH